ncbi:MAG TPA: nucleotide exchange factor GrpE [Thermoanaerobaculia bacterium]|nr:nucleotide exchange factor GrpE [Thermoanaerobaculia bacterium]
MTEDNEQSSSTNMADDDTYVLEDTGESLEDFVAETVEDDKGEEAPSVAGSPVASGSLHGLQEENQKLKDQYVRRLADFENYRKRVEREKGDYFKYALSEIIRELVPVLDNFERALVSSAGDPPSEFRTGVEMISKQFSDALQRSGVRSVGESDVPFDPTFHEAVMREENASVPNNTVLDVFQKGYFLHDRLVRPAMVKVAVGGPDKSEPESQTS